MAQRRAKSREFFAGAGSTWDDLRQELFGTAVGGGALLGLLDGNWVVGDLGCGSGHLTALLAPFVGRVIAVDASSSMLDRAKARLAGVQHVELRSGELEVLPVADGELDAAVISLVLHHTPDPRRVIAEAMRVLKPGGRLLVVDLLPHDRAEYRRTPRPRLARVFGGAGDRVVEERRICASERRRASGRSRSEDTDVVRSHWSEVEEAGKQEAAQDGLTE